MFLISSAQLLTFEPAIPAACLRQAWHFHTRTKTFRVVTGEINREILRLKCYWYSDPDLWKQPSVTAQMSNLKCGLPAARKWQTGSLFWGCSQLQPLAEHPSHKAGSWTFRACALLRSCCSTATCCWITVPVSEVSMVVLPTGSSICTRVWDSGLCSQDCLCILHETVTR